MSVRPSPVEQAATPAGAPVLVSGASFAGLATAYWMNRLGYSVTVVEVARELRWGGTPVDIQGETIGILTRMGMIDAVRAHALPPRAMEFKTAEDSTIGVLDPNEAASEAPAETYEIHRDDLLRILFAAVESSAELKFGRSIRYLEDVPDAVRVTFDDGSVGDYALVFGCDGNRSTTRRLAFGDTGAFSHFMGCYFVIKVVPKTGLLPANISQIFSVPGRTAFLNGYDRQTDIALVFRTQRELDYDFRDRALQRRMIHDHFDGLGWKVPAMLQHLDADDDFYFDKVNQIRMPAWSKGRVVLVGDAGYCVSPLAGMGGSMAIIGAARLADALHRHGHDHIAAFADYHANLHLFVQEVQDRAVSVGLPMMFPADDAEIARRNHELTLGTLDL